MSTVYEQTDGFIPNQQTPPATSVLGTADDPFTSIIGTTVSGTTIGAGSNLYLAGATAAKLYRETGVNFVAGTAKAITHGLNTLYPAVQVWGSGVGGGPLLQYDTSGNVAVARITAISGASVDVVHITTSLAVLGGKVVVIG